MLLRISEKVVRAYELVWRFKGKPFPRLVSRAYADMVGTDAAQQYDVVRAGICAARRVFYRRDALVYAARLNDVLLVRQYLKLPCGRWQCDRCRGTYLRRGVTQPYPCPQVKCKGVCHAQ